MRPTNTRSPLKDPNAPLFYNLRKPSYDAETPIFPGITIWRYYPMHTGDQIFPSIEFPTTISADYPKGIAGQDLDGTVIGMILDGPERGRTFIYQSATTPDGNYKPPTIN